jgi:phosphatidylethanolamine/phosphatidyl-N-methylethanolamine N-methyltransferase
MRNNENVVFFKSLLKAPLKTGAFFPSSRNLASSISSFVNIPEPDEYILEIGAGTGRLTSALLDRGIPGSQLIILEMQPSLVKFLRKTVPCVTVIEGNATDLLSLLPEKTIGNIQTIVSGIPMVNLRLSDQQQIVTAVKNVMKPDGTLLQFTYRPGSPLPSSKLGLDQRYLGHVFLNMPPAAIWEYKTAHHTGLHPASFAFMNHFKFKRAGL